MLVGTTISLFNDRSTAVDRLSFMNRLIHGSSCTSAGARVGSIAHDVKSFIDAGLDRIALCGRSHRNAAASELAWNPSPEGTPCNELR
jgi:hypothetical protein